jgi:hypothetical protein
MKKGPSPENDLTAIREEQKAFDAALEELLKDHAGQFVLLKGGKAIGFYPSYADAYRAGLQHFGVNAVFLVSEVKRRDGEPASISWCTGAMSVQT